MPPTTHSGPRAPAGLEHKAASATPESGLIEADDATGVVEAIVSVTGVVDEDHDVIKPGAYTKTLLTRRPKGIFVHDWGRWVARTDVIEELMPGDSRLPKTTKDGKQWPGEAGGLYVKATFNLDTTEGRDAYSNVKFFSESGECEWSVGYKVPPGKSVRTKSGERHIEEMDLFEYSPVLFGAAPLSGTLSVKSAAGTAEVDTDVQEEPEESPEDVQEPEEDTEEGTEEEPDAVLDPEVDTDLGEVLQALDELEEIWGGQEEGKALFNLDPPPLGDPMGVFREFRSLNVPDIADTTMRNRVQAALFRLDQAIDGGNSSLAQVEVDIVLSQLRNVGNNPEVQFFLAGTDAILRRAGEAMNSPFMKDGEDDDLEEKARNWSEQLHPRDGEGQFSSGGGGGASSGSAPRVRTPHSGPKLGTARINDVGLAVARHIAPGNVTQATASSVETGDYIQVDTGPGHSDWARVTARPEKASGRYLTVDAIIDPLAEGDRPVKLRGYRLPAADTIGIVRNRDVKAAEDDDLEDKTAAGGHHVPGTPYNWRHDWEPLNAATAAAHGKPFGDKKPSGGSSKPSGSDSGPAADSGIDKGTLKRLGQWGRADGGTSPLKPSQGRLSSSSDLSVGKSGVAKDSGGDAVGRIQKVGANSFEYQHHSADAPLTIRTNKMALDALVRQQNAYAAAHGGKNGPEEGLETKGMGHESLDRSPKKNWVEKAGELPAYIEHIAKDIAEKNGTPLDRAIPMAIAAVKKWAAGGEGVNPDTRAKATTAVAEWEALKAKARAGKKDVLDEEIMESAHYPFLPGTYEELREQIRDGATETLSALWADVSHVEVMGTWPDYAVVTAYHADGKALSYEMPYTVSAWEDGQVGVHLDEPVQVELKVSVGGNEENGQDLLPYPSVLEDVTVDLKALFAHAETKAGRVLSAVNEKRLLAAVENLVAVLGAAGLEVDASARVKQEEEERNNLQQASVYQDSTAPSARAVAGEGKTRLDPSLLARAYRVIGDAHTK